MPLHHPHIVNHIGRHGIHSKLLCLLGTLCILYDCLAQGHFPQQNVIIRIIFYFLFHRPHSIRPWKYKKIPLCKLLLATASICDGEGRGGDASFPIPQPGEIPRELMRDLAEPAGFRDTEGFLPAWSFGGEEATLFSNVLPVEMEDLSSYNGLLTGGARPLHSLS